MISDESGSWCPEINGKLNISSFHDKKRKKSLVQLTLNAHILADSQVEFLINILIHRYFWYDKAEIENYLRLRQRSLEHTCGRVVKILDSKYEKANLNKIVEGVKNSLA